MSPFSSDNSLESSQSVGKQSLQGLSGKSDEPSNGLNPDVSLLAQTILSTSEFKSEKDSSPSLISRYNTIRN